MARTSTSASAEVGKYIAQGYKAVRAQCGVPGIKKAYGISNLKNAYEPAESELPAETVWATPKYLEHRAEAVRAAAQGSRPRHRTTARRASPPHADRSRAARQERSSRIGCSGWKTRRPRKTRRSFELIRKHTVTPLAVGEVFNSIWDCKYLHREPADRLHPDDHRARRRHHARASHRGLRGAARRAHGLPRRDGSVAGVHGRGAALRHVGAELRHPGIHEARAGDRRGVPARLHVQGRPAVLRRDRRATASRIDEKLAAKYPYNPKQLPVARLEDGTMWDW